MASPSYAPVYSSAPKVRYPYIAKNALDDLPGVAYALELFLASKMHESEEYCNQADPRKERLYFATGYGLIQCVKGMMSYADEDLLAALGHTKHAVQIANAHRKPAPFFASRLAGFVVPSLSTSAFIRSMNDVQRHAELVYAESLFEKALLGILYSGDWLSFIKEAMNMRTTVSIYRQLGKYIDVMDEEYTASMRRKSGNVTPSSIASSLSNSTYTSASTSVASSSTNTSVTSPQVSQSSSTNFPASTTNTSAGIPPRLLESPSIDVHFRSGVYLGLGLSNIVLSLMPARLMSLVELFGYGGDRKMGLDLLERAGGWEGTSDTNPEPKISSAQEGCRRTICDMSLLIFHLILSSFTFDRVDVSVAGRVLDWNLKRYPNGVFFLFAAGRLNLSRSQPTLALEYYQRARTVQTQYRNLQLLSYWEESVANLCLWNLGAALDCYDVLVEEATWSKTTYTYGRAVCLLELAEDDPTKIQGITALMVQVPNLRQRIAGKSIPLEKFVARKARKYQSQGNSLTLPALELAYLFLSITHAPRAVLTGKMLPAVEAALDKLKPDSNGYSDNFCLARFLEGVVCRFIAYPDPDAILNPDDVVQDTASRAIGAFMAVLENGAKIELDHYLVYHTHYELGRLLACQGNTDGARTHFELVLSGKVLEDTGRKGKYSLENALHMRTQAAVEALHQKRL